MIHCVPYRGISRDKASSINPFAWTTLLRRQQRFGFSAPSFRSQRRQFLADDPRGVVSSSRERRRQRHGQSRDADAASKRRQRKRKSERTRRHSTLRGHGSGQSRSLLLAKSGERRKLVGLGNHIWQFDLYDLLSR